MNRVIKTFLIILGFTILFLSGCQTRKYDSYDAEKYADDKLDIEVKSIYCTGEIGFEGSVKYNLDSDEREVCFILGENQGVEYVYSYGSRVNTKRIPGEPSVSSSEVMEYIEDLGIEVKHWKCIYLKEIDSLAYQVVTSEEKEFFILKENTEYKYYMYTSNEGLINITLQDIVELIG